MNNIKIFFCVFMVQKKNKTYHYWMEDFMNIAFHPTKMYLFLLDKHQIGIFFKYDFKTEISISRTTS